MSRLLAGSVEAARDAAASARPVTLALGRIALDLYPYNLSPRTPAWSAVVAKSGAAPTPSSPDWNPELLSPAASFGSRERTFSLVSFRAAEGRPVASLFHVACHAVSIYPSNLALSADWPGPAP